MIPLKVKHSPSIRASATVLVLAANCLVFILQVSSGLPESVQEFGFVPYFLFHPFTPEVQAQKPVVIESYWGGRALVLQETVVPRPRPGPWASIFTSMFMHGDWFHIIFNLLFLWVFGRSIEGRMGHVRFLLFYLFCGLGAALVHALFHPGTVEPMVGASGAISGVMGAFFLLYPRTRVVAVVPFFFFFHLVELPAFIFLGIWFLFQLLSLGSPSDVAFLAHVGGFIIGLILTSRFVLRPARPRRQFL